MSKEKYNILLVSGVISMDHDRRVNEWLRTLLEACGKFNVVITEEFRGANAETLANYDAILINGNRYDLNGETVGWGETAQKSLEDFVKSGKGVIFYHLNVMRSGRQGGIELKKMIGVDYSFEGGARKSPKLDMVVDFKYGSPITDGLAPASWGTPCDDLFVPTGIAPEAENVQVLATVYDALEDYDNEKMQKHVLEVFNERGQAYADLPNINQDQPVAWTNTYGEGRVFCCSIGHGPDTIRRPPFVALMCRGVEWACAGEVTIDPPDLQFDNRYRVWPYYLDVNTRDIARMLKT